MLPEPAGVGADFGFEAAAADLAACRDVGARMLMFNRLPKCGTSAINNMLRDLKSRTYYHLNISYYEYGFDPDKLVRDAWEQCVASRHKKCVRSQHFEYVSLPSEEYGRER